jgi:polar amino acid transport system substrate-binding protein
MTLRRTLGLLFVGALALAACTTGAQQTPSPQLTASPVPDSACGPQDTSLRVAGRLTIGTDNPAFPPYFDPPTGDETAGTPGNGGQPWEIGDPANGRGFESAVAYEVANRLGFDQDAVDWIYVPFVNAYAPGAKDFDIDINQVSHTRERARQVDMSHAYYFVNQALVANADTPITSATSLADIQGYQLGAAVGTTSLTYITDVIQPTTEASVYNDNDGAIAALDAGQIDGIVVDLPTAFFITAAQMDNGVIVGQFPTAGDEQEYFSLVLEKDSPLTECVDQALDDMYDDGTLDAITQEWLSDKADAPVIEP